MLRVNSVILSAALIVGLAAVINATYLPKSVASDEFTEVSQARDYARGLSHAFQHVATKLEPSVVSIRSMRKVEATTMRIPSGLRFFDLPTPDTFQFQQRGMGTGVVVDIEGYILTNNHVVDSANKIEVTLHDGTTREGKLVGADQKSDLAVVKIEHDDLTAAVLGDSDHIPVGEWVVAMGSPFGLSQTVTAGIVSAKGRANVGIADYEDFIQTDAAINPGNSGGPLVNLDGEVVGINTAIATRNGGFQGIGFAIPVNMAKSVMEDLIADGSVSRGFLGVAIQDLTRDLAESFSFEGKDGVLVGDVTADSPAARAGLREGDIIVKFNGRETTKMHELRNLVAATSPGTRASVEYFRAGQRESANVELGSLESAPRSSAPSHELGVSIEPLTSRAVRKLGIEEEDGVLVTRVERGSLADLAGLEPGDVIVSLGGRSIGSPKDFRNAASTVDLEKGCRVQVLKNGMRRYLFLKKQ